MIPNSSQKPSSPRWILGFVLEINRYQPDKWYHAPYSATGITGTPSGYLKTTAGNGDRLIGIIHALPAWQEAFRQTVLFSLDTARPVPPPPTVQRLRRYLWVRVRSQTANRILWLIIISTGQRQFTSTPADTPPRIP